ncbi:Predicted outer membrane protein [[Eubacterium] siraeum]|uniref:Predicted outer membrane protein n=1 Tax=[Eubacterium] siraeum TaxID=39492 RepID=A0A174Z9F6_9FIRM|nr:Predicted outer membrane protein [[Eubacterium] siraeum]
MDGITFRIQGEGVDKTVKTANGGVIQVDNLKPGVYTVTETEYDKYIPQEVRRVTVVSGQVSTVNFSNKLRRGDLTVKKTAEDGLTEGMKFRLYGTSISGIEVNEYAVTDKNGIAKFKNVLIGSGYTLEEVDTPTRYVVPEKQTAAIEWNKVTNKSFDNILKKFNVTVTKSDSEKGLPQGDASLAGAKYGIYKGTQLIDTYTTDTNGSFTTKWYICGDDWSLKEISPSEGYLLNTESQHIGAEAKLYTVEYNLAKPLDSLENVIKGKIAVIKHCDDGSTKIETPEKGAEFEVYLAASGSYENAKETERDILVCDENGFAETKDLPYGEYTVKQTKGWEGKELLAPFNVFVKENGETYRFLINNATFEALIEIVKKDAETGKIIPAAGIGFKVRNTDTGEYIVQHINYPTPVDIDTYYTDVTGKLMMPEKLPYGNYEIIEQCTAYGYVLDSAPIAFKVDGSKTVVTVEKHNMPQKGIVNISKSGEVFFSAVESDGVYSFVFADKGLAGAVYEITAAEDIITPDGTLRYAKGAVVDTVTTNENGSAASKPLYLGKYTVRETKAPYGMVLNDEAKSVELTYAGETVKLTETSAEFYNERQKAEVSLSKILGKDETFGIGNNGEILSVQFGLYAAEDLTAADGSSVPTDGLLEIANCNENGSITFKTDIPVGTKLYVKEIAADSHYILSDEKYPVTFDYAGQDTVLVEIKADGGEAIKNDILYGSVKGLKIDRETEAVIAGAKFGLFRSGETEFTAESAILTVESGEDGVFTFENIPYGDWLIKELQPADGYLANEEIYPVRIGENGQTIGITVVNDRIPEIKTHAAVDGDKEVCATEVFTLTDTVSYSHLIPGKEYVLKGTLMDKNTGKVFTENDKAVTAETVFTPETPNGTVTVTFTFDARLIRENTSLVVFETLYKDGKELAVHADINDNGQTVKVKVPEIGTKATVDGKKEVTASGRVKIEDIVSYKNLTPGKEYAVKGVLMNKATGEPLLADGKEIRSSFTFKPDKPDGEINITFVFDASGLKTAAEIVVFETLYRDGTEIAAHADIKDEGQTVKITPPTPDNPQTGDNSNLGFWIGLGAVALGGIIAVVIIRVKSRKDEDDE